MDGHPRALTLADTSCRRARRGIGQRGTICRLDDFFQAGMGYSLGARPFGVPHTEWTVIRSGCSL